MRPLAEREFPLDVLVVDDSDLYRRGLAGMLEREVGAGSVMTAADVGEALAQVGTSSPDVVLLNMATTRSVAVLRAIVAAVPQAPVVAVGIPEADDQVIACAEAGAAGFLFRGESFASLIAVIQAVTRGEFPCSPVTAATLLRRVAALAAERLTAGNGARLTPREQQVVRLIDEGLSNKEIARRLSIEVRTVKNHVHSILEKLQVRRRGEAAARIRAAGASRLSGEPG
jgi:DNA-binding NarL/FixJ family response regulator